MNPFNKSKKPDLHFPTMKQQYFSEQVGRLRKKSICSIWSFNNMKRLVKPIVAVLFLLVFMLFLSEFAWSANCEFCSVTVPAGSKYCYECETKFMEDQTGKKAREEHLVNALDSQRDRYRNALADLSQFYLDMGYPNRLEKVRKEIKALNKMPLYEYLLTIERSSTIKPDKNIEEANILFEDGKMYKKSLNLINKRSNLNIAIKRFKKILEHYPESDLADDSAYEMAEIFEGYFFQDYEVAAAYYIKCFELNPDTDHPARFRTARVYEEHLKDYSKAMRYYELALKMCKDENLRKKAQLIIDELKKLGY
ncbi:MAG: hypothetical protein GY941_09500 [Planctomycetes bacterium]|nr:hypothetical protein [Planctomycetota bacterium]